MKYLNTKILTLTLSGLALLTVGSDVHAHHPAGKGGKITVAVPADIGGWDPLKASNNSPGRLEPLWAVFDKMFDIDPDTGKLLPLIALSGKSSDDFKEWTITLRQGVKFSNGKEFTSDAYVTHFNRLMNSHMWKRYSAFLGPLLESVTAVDKYNVLFKFAGANPTFPQIMAHPIPTQYTSEPEHVRANGKSPNFNKTPIGAGPYMLKSWRPGQGMTLVRNPHYWNKKAQHLDEITVIVNRTEAPVFKAILAGNVDLMTSETREFLNAAKKSPLVNVNSGPAGSAGRIFAWNQAAAPLDDIRVRQALILSINRGEMTKIGSGEAIEPSKSWYGKGNAWHCPNVSWPEFNPTKARQLLKDYGKKVEFTLGVLNRGITGKWAEFMQSQWRENLGVNIPLEMHENNGAYSRALYQGKFAAYTIHASYNIDPAIHHGYFEKIFNTAARIKSPKVMGAFEAAKTATEYEDRRKKNCQFQQELINDAAYLGWDVPERQVYSSLRVKGIQKPFTRAIPWHRVWVEE